MLLIVFTKQQLETARAVYGAVSHSPPHLVRVFAFLVFKDQQHNRRFYSKIVRFCRAHLSQTVFSNTFANFTPLMRNTIILHIDDDSDDLDMLQTALHAIDPLYTILVARDGEEGLQLLSDMKNTGTLPCLIILDINMPKLDGRQTFQIIKKDPVLCPIPIVIFSTSSSSLDKLFFSAENVEYITKPYEYAHLLEVAKRLLSLC